MAVEVRNRHLAGKQKRHRAGEEAGEEQQASEYFQRTGYTGKDPSGAVPPSGIIAAGKANSFVLPTCMKRKAATILRTLSNCGARLCHFETMVGRVMMRGSLGVPMVAGGLCLPRCPATFLAGSAPR